jgi:excisionase family DNA binding protein
MTAKESKQAANTKRLFTIKELAAEIGGTKWFWRSMIWDAQLPCVRVGKKMFVDRNDVEAFIEKNKHRN